LSSYCIDTSVFIKYLCPDEQEGAATELVGWALSGRIVIPCFAWAEIASVLRKKIRSGLLTEGEAGQLYSAFGELPIDYVDGEDIRERAWEMARMYGLLTLYDAVGGRERVRQLLDGRHGILEGSSSQTVLCVRSGWGE